MPWAARTGPDRLESVTPRALEVLAAEPLDPERVQGRGPLTLYTVHSYLGAVNKCFRWARQEGEPVPDRATAPLPSRPKNLRLILERTDIERLEQLASTERDRLLVRVLADTGIRVGELVGLHCDDLLVRARGSFLLVPGKGDRDRHVPIRPELARPLQRYIERTRPSSRKGAPDVRHLADP